MQPAELRKAKRYLNQLERHNSLVRQDSERPAREQLGYDAFRKEWAVIGDRIHGLASKVLERELGLERYMVVHLIRADGHESKFQVLTFGFRCDWGRSGRRWMWEFSGKKLRKDGTLGSTNGGMGFDVAWIERRKLDGFWEALSLRVS